MSSIKLKNLFSLLILFTLIFLSKSAPSLDEGEKKDDDPEMVVGYISLKFKINQGMLIAPVKAGTPEQEMNLVLDIGSPRTWISDQAFKKGDISAVKKGTGEDSFRRKKYEFLQDLSEFCAAEYVLLF